MGQGFSSLAARHLRRQRALLALWRHTLEAPSLLSAEWRGWLRARQSLLEEIEWPPITVEAGPDHSSFGQGQNGRHFGALRVMRERELHLMAAIARLDAALLLAARAQVRAVGRLLEPGQRRVVCTRAMARNQQARGSRPGLSARG